MSEPGEQAALGRALSELQSPDLETRVRGIRRLRVIGGPPAVAALLEALDDSDEEARARAAIALGQMEAREVVPTLIERLKRSPEVEAREICVFALAQIGDPQAVPALIDALQDPSEVVVRLACTALPRLDDSRATEPLLELLEHSSWHIRHAASEALLRMKTTDASLAAALERLVQEPEAQENQAVLQNIERSLNRLKSADARENTTAQDNEQDRHRAFEMSMGQLRDADPQVRIRAVMRLWPQGVRKALSVLVEQLLNDESANVRAQCAWHIYAYGGEAGADALRQALTDTDRSVLIVAAMAAARSGDGTAIPQLWALLEHPGRNVRYAASRALVRLKAADELLVSTLEKLALDPEAEEHDLEVEEWICNQGIEAGSDQQLGNIEAWPAMKMHELVEQARQLEADAEL